MFLQKNLIGLLHYDPLADVCILYNLTFFYSVSLIFFFRLWQLLIFLVLTMQKNYLHVVSNTHLCKYPFSILLPEFLDVSYTTLLCWMLEKEVSIVIYRAFFTLVNITYNFSKVRVGLPGVCLSKAMIKSKMPPWHFQTVMVNARSTAWA